MYAYVFTTAEQILMIISVDVMPLEISLDLYIWLPYRW
jgi:hypothetical protein